MHGVRGVCEEVRGGWEDDRSEGRGVDAGRRVCILYVVPVTIWSQCLYTWFAFRFLSPLRCFNVFWSCNSPPFGSAFYMGTIQWFLVFFTSLWNDHFYRPPKNHHTY